MDNIKSFKQLLEAKLKDNSGVDGDYLKSIEDRAMELYDGGGLSHQEHMEIGRLFGEIMRLQHGHEEELAKIGEEIIMESYGSILDGVELDLKIVRPDDPEKREMVNKMFEEPQVNDNEEEQDNQEEDNELEINTESGVEIEADVNEVDKRKILNNIMQGEAQNVHTMLFNKKDEIDAISNGVVETSLRFLELNEKIIWDSNKPPLEEMMKRMPDMANAVEVDWKKNCEDGNCSKGESQEEETKVIKVRAIELTMVIHEAVKGIYELIMANAIPADSEMAKKIMMETDTIGDEEEDIKYGKFIASDLNTYIVGFIDEFYPNAASIDNIKEFVYGGLAALNAEIFLDFMKKVLTGDSESANRILKNTNIVEDIIASFDEYDNFDDEDYSVEPQDNNQQNDEPMYVNMSPSELDKELNIALDSGDFEKVREIQKYL